MGGQDLDDVVDGARYLVSEQHVDPRRIGAVLICHGMVDTNVHFQDSVRLVQRLIELRKEDWELAVYPVESHAFEEETSWADEYDRILKLFERKVRSQGRPAG